MVLAENAFQYWLDRECGDCPGYGVGGYREGVWDGEEVIGTEEQYWGREGEWC